MQTLKHFILKKLPQVVVVSAECRETVAVVDDIKMCIAELEQENQISVEALDGEVARVFMSSPRSEVHFMRVFAIISTLRLRTREKKISVSYYAKRFCDQP